MAKKIQTKHLGIRCDPKLREKIIKGAKQSRRTVSDFLRLIIEAKLNEPSMIPDRID